MQSFLEVTVIECVMCHDLDGRPATLNYLLPSSLKIMSAYFIPGPLCELAISHVFCLLGIILWKETVGVAAAGISFLLCKYRLLELAIA